MGVRRGPRAETGPGARLEPDTAGYFRRALETLQDGLSAEELALFAPTCWPRRWPRGRGWPWTRGGRGCCRRCCPGPPWGWRPPSAGTWWPLPGTRPAASWCGRCCGCWGASRGQEPPSCPWEGRGQRPRGRGQRPRGRSFPPRSRPSWSSWPTPSRSSCPRCSPRPAPASACRGRCRRCTAANRPPAPASATPSLASWPRPAPPQLRARWCGRCRTPSAVGCWRRPWRVAGARRLRELFQQQLKGRLRGVATHRVANHGLQRLLDHAPADVVREVLCELGPALAEPLARGHPGVLTALTGACRRHPGLQQEALRHLFQAFGCWEPRERRRGCVALLGGLRPFGGGDKDEGPEPEPSLGPVTLHGSLLLQHLLHFGDPGPVVGGLEALPPPALAALARSPPGSRVWDALLASPTVPTRARRRLLRKLKGHFLSLACHRNGSRVLDAVWASASAPARAAIAGELASQREALQRDPHGRGVARTLALDLFLRRRRLWERLQAAPDRRRGLLAPVLED
ncbi:unnamed protein product [Bubo scandiacus]